MLKAPFFQNNRTSLVEKTASDSLIVITANGLMQRSADTAFTFRQESNFFYLTGINEPNVILVIDPKKQEEYLILPKRTQVEEYFGGSIDEQEMKNISGIEKIYRHQEGWGVLKHTLSNHKKIKTLLAPPIQFTRQDRIFSSPARRLLIQKLRRLSKLPIEGLHDELTALRRIKQPAELKIIKNAIEVTKAGFERVRAEIKAGKYEYEVEALFDYEFKVRQSQHGYVPPIVAAGSNAATLHYAKGKSQIKAGDFVLIDIGAEVNCYTADITRTYCAGKQTNRQNDIYQSVKTVHAKAQQLLKDGLDWREYIIAVDHAIGEELIKLKLITLNSRDRVRPYFPHGISHSLGLDVHDICDYKIIEENMVITVEPGIYIPEEGIGVRIEDDVLITKNGFVNLSDHISYD